MSTEKVKAGSIATLLNLGHCEVIYNHVNIKALIKF